MRREEISNNNNKQHFNHKHILTHLQIDEVVEETRCNACGCDVDCDSGLDDKQLYGCTDCKYFLHEKCAEAPRSIEHRSHPSHRLTLHAAPTYSNQSFICNACGHVGDGFCYSCAHCSFDLHIFCSAWPHTTLVEEEHPHELQLVFEQEKLLTPDMISICSLCDAVNTECRWIYYCETCNFGFHLHCKMSKVLKEDEEETKEETVREINEANSRAKTTRQELEHAILESLDQGNGSRCPKVGRRPS
ncbi:PREDICTED: uncharacterized protein LOC105969431 [Erythranthe guttata]|uniref:uncharacterized protein LOC105969431 n=1 Tax=Erythranthe guttata TaxID=4155 RepID=UPI00064D987E|nr:PREDICTED: uncharacterized protein LOC105969431 [Erythranthe guttata]|eukprot:XP_012849640.1 PREDICTED: uncharacterized protein LOC105969431 [Erythranthe guttata]